MFWDEPDRTQGSRATPGERASEADVASAAFGADGYGGAYFSDVRRTADAYAQDIARIAAATGVTLENPTRVSTADLQRRLDGARSDDDVASIYRSLSETGYMEAKRKLAEQYPQHLDAIRPDRAPSAIAGEMRKAADERLTDALSRSDAVVNVPLLGPVSPGLLAGGLPGMLTNPFNVAAMAVSGPTGVGAKAVLWGGLKASAANAVATGLEQPFIKSWRNAAGLEYSWSDAGRAIAGAAAFGFAADVGVRGVSRGGQRLLKRAPVLDEAGNVTGWHWPDADADRVGARSDPLPALETAARNAPEGSDLARAAAGDEAALARTVEQAGLASDPAMRGALQTMEADRMLAVPEGIDPAEHAMRLATAGRQSEMPLAPPPGDAILKGDRPVTPEREAEAFSKPSLELAADIRGNPEILREALPWSDGKLRQAVLLSRLSDQAFDRVAAGEGRADLAALVGEHVSETGRHADLLSALEASDPATLPAARTRLAELMDRPGSPETFGRLAGASEGDIARVSRTIERLDDSRGPEALAQLEQLRERHADAIAKARAPDDVKAPAAEAPTLQARELQAAIADAARALPKGIKIRSFVELADLPREIRGDVEAARAGGHAVAGLTDAAGDIWIAESALSPRATLAHETIQALRRRGVLSDSELRMLAAAADRKGDVWNKAAYEKAYAGLDDRGEALLQEAAAHAYEARARGVRFDTEANTVLDRIRNFFDRIRNTLLGRGFRTADDLMSAIERGDLAKRPAGDAKPGASLFSLQEEGQSRNALAADLAEAERDPDLASRLQKERAALINEGVRQRNNDLILGYRDARGQHDPAQAMAGLIEWHGKVTPPENWRSVAGEAKAIEGLIKSEMEEALHTFRPTLLGHTRETALLGNVVREMAGEGTGDAAAQGLAKTFGAGIERLRQMANAAGADIAPLKGWFLPQFHDRLALLNATKTRWVDDIWRHLDVDRILRENRDPASPEMQVAASKTRDAAIARSAEQRAASIAEHDETVKTNQQRTRRDAAEGRSDIVTAHEDRLAILKAERDQAIGQARSIRDQKMAEVAPAARDVLRERFLHAKSEIERAHDTDVVKATKERDKLLERYDRKVSEAADDAEKAAGKARAKVVERADAEHATAVDTAQAAHERELAPGIPLTRERLREILGTIWEDISSDGHGTLADNRAAPFAGVEPNAPGRGSYTRQRSEHRFLHFKDAEAWLAYQAEYGGGADPFKGMMAHVSKMSKDIAALRVLGTAPERELARLSAFTMKQAAMARPIGLRIESAVERVATLARESLAEPQRLIAVTERIGRIREDLDASTRHGLLPARTEARRTALRAELASLTEESARLVDSRGPIPTAADMRSELARGEAAHTMSADAVEQPDPYHAWGEMSGKLSPEANARFQVHGVGGMDRSAGLLSLLTKGIDSERTFHSGPPQGQSAGAGSLATRSNSPFLILSEPGKKIPETGIRNVVLQGPAEALKAKLQGAFPDVTFMSVDEAHAFMETGQRPSLPVADRAKGELRAALANVTADGEEAYFPRRTELLGRGMDPLAAGWSSRVRPEDYARGWIATSEAMWDAFTGQMSAPVSIKWATRMQDLRNAAVVVRGGSMVISSTADSFVSIPARMFVGAPLHGALTSTLRQFLGANRRELARAGYVAEEYLHMRNEGARSGVHGGEMPRWLAERTIALQGLGRLTDAQRQGFGYDLQGMLAGLARHDWDELGRANAPARRMLERYGFREEAWNAIRHDERGLVHDVDMLSPNLVKGVAETTGKGGEHLAERYLAMLLQETEYAGASGMLRARAAMFGQTRPGTISGEALRVGGQFKSFAVMAWMLHVERAMREIVEHGARGGLMAGATIGAAYAATYLVSSTLGGALVVQLKNLRSGKEPEPMNTPTFWGRALVQGGGLGLWGDLIASDANRFGGGAAGTFAGPVVGLLEDVAKPVISNIAAAARGKKTSVGGDAAKTMAQWVPGTSLWYTSLIYQRLVAEQFQRALDPDAWKSFNTRRQKQKHDYGSDFWWAPGEARPR